MESRSQGRKNLAPGLFKHNYRGFLTDADITAELKRGSISIHPFSRENLGSNSYDLTTYHEARIITEQSDSDPTRHIPTTKIHLLPLTLSPGSAAILRTSEIIKVPKYCVGVISQRSNLARFPILLNFSYLADSGFEGALTATVINVAKFPITIQKNLRFLQIMFYRLAHPVKTPYLERKSSKNISQFKGVPEYQIDREFLK